MPLEIACFNLASALVASLSGADRIELCSGAQVGGTTPVLTDLQTLKTQLQHNRIPVNVMIRPRGGDFVYTSDEFAQMERQIEEFESLADGFVFGILNEDGTVDIERNGRMMQLGKGKPCTFHRAFDSIPNLASAFDEIAQLGFSAILTSGGKPDALSGQEELAELVKLSEVSKLSKRKAVDVIVGGGLRSGNIEVLKHVTRAEWFHSSALVDATGVASGDEVKRLVDLLRPGG
jgi:copper homeostasis protein